MSTPLERITRRVTRHGDPNDPEGTVCLLTLEEFFDGNDNDGSIAANLPSTPTSAEMFDLLRAIRARPEVADVRVHITMFDDPDFWPYSDTVWVITRASVREVASWFADDVRPDDFFEGFPATQRFEPVEIPAGHTAIGCWWD